MSTSEMPLEPDNPEPPYWGKNVFAFIMNILRVFLVIAFSTLLLTVVGQVIARYIFNSPPFWTEELARFLLIWLSFMGAVLCQYHREHIGATMLIDLLPPTGRFFADMLIAVVVIATLCVLAYAGWSIARIGTSKSPALGITMSWIYISLFVSMALMLLVTIGQTIGEIAKFAKGKPHVH